MRFILISLSIAMLTALSACNRSEDPSSPGNMPGTPKAAPGDSGAATPSTPPDMPSKGTGGK